MSAISTCGESGEAPSEFLLPSVEATLHLNEKEMKEKLALFAFERDARANLGAKMLPEFGKYGLHILQLLVDACNREALMNPIEENEDFPQADFVTLLDTSKPAQLVGYARMLLEHIKGTVHALLKKPEDAPKPSAEMLRFAFSGILKPLSDTEQMEKELPSIISILISYNICFS